MDFISIILKQLEGFDPLAIGYIIICYIVFKLRYEVKKDIETFNKRLSDIDSRNEKEIIGFMKEVNESIKEERKLNYQLINEIDKEIHDVLRQIGECVGELRGKKEQEK